MLLAVAIADLAAATADAAQYKALLCAGNVGSNSYGASMNSPHFVIENGCGPAPDPAGNAAFLRIAENQPDGNMTHGAYALVHWDSPPYVHFKTAGGWTRQPNAFNDGWRSRFWAFSIANQGFEILSQGKGLGITPHFSPHIWPGGNADFWRFVFELSCARPGGCDRSNYNATELNTLTFTLEDEENSHVWLTNLTPLMTGNWTRGQQTATFSWTERGSGMRYERILIDGAQRWSIDHLASGECNLGESQVSGEYARVFQPCPNAENIPRHYTFDTASLSDGAHTLQVCTKDYGQMRGLNGTGSETCDGRTIRTDNTAPGAPSGLTVTSANPNRYSDRFGAQFTLPPNHGSPITKVHYQVINATGEAVKSEQVVSATNPTSLIGLEGPAKAGDYRLRVWLEDEVGLIGSAAVAPIPHDTTPPAAPQGVSVTSSSISRAEQDFDVRWHNITDGGSAIAAAHYQVLNAAGEVVVATHDLRAEGIESIASLDAPPDRGSFTMRLWLSDAEGNVGAPVGVPLAYDCVRSEVGGGTALSAGLGRDGLGAEIVTQDRASSLSGQLRGRAGGVAGAALCVFSTVVTDAERDFLGIALTGQGGGYRFAVGPGPSRNLSVIYRSDQRQLGAQALVQTRVRPTLRVARKVVHNKGYARFLGEIPGPRNDNVVVVIQVKSNEGWRAFRRYRTRAGGRFDVRYRFSRTTTLTDYVMRAQVRAQSGYPYLPGNSRLVSLRVLP